MLTKDLLNELFSYDSETGELKWRVNRSNVTAGTPIAGVTANGYLSVSVGGKTHQAHRLIWLMYHGFLPANSRIDHINGNRKDNRISNLRLATDAQNASNAKLSVKNTTGFKGVSRTAYGFGAHVNKDGRKTFLGVFKTPEDAARAYDSAALEAYGEFARTNKMMGLL
jgi:hypothetical protein